MRKTAFITGASRGIGRAIAKKMAEEGYDLYLTGFHNGENLISLKEELEKKYMISCDCFIGDISDASFVKSCFLEISNLDVLINNAGISYVGLLTDMTVSQWHQVIDTNLSAAFYTCQQAIPLMLQKKKGRIFNISSVWGNVGASTEVAYSASKGGLNSFTKSLAKELAPSNIQVNAIACGVIDTDMNACFSPEDMALLKEEIPADRIGCADEVAGMIVSLLTAPDYLTGQIISLDGGWQ